MANIEIERQKFVKYFKNFTRFKSNEFDEALKSAHKCAIDYGLSEGEMILLTNAAFRQNLAVFRLRKVIQCLIPVTFVPEEAVQNVLRWFLSNYNQNTSGSLLKYVLQWLAGVVEYNLTDVSLINSYYDLFYYFLPIIETVSAFFLCLVFDLEQGCTTQNMMENYCGPHGIDGKEILEKYTKKKLSCKFNLRVSSIRLPCFGDILECNVACKLLYLLTKPIDVNRWYVKQVLRVHEKYSKPKYTGALLYLFKTYQPQCVPENIPAYAVYTAFGRSSANFISGFSRAQDQIKKCNLIPASVDEIVWIQKDFRRHGMTKKSVQLIPPVAQTESVTNTQNENGMSLLSVHNAKDLNKYHLSSNCPSRILSLLNNQAGFHILKFSDQNVQDRFSYQLYYVLHDVFLERNSLVAEEEKENFLRKIASLQADMQQSIPVVSKFLARYISRWDGYEYKEMVYDLIRWLHVVSFDELNSCILEPLYDLFLSGSIQAKCDILNALADLAINFVFTFRYQSSKNLPGIFQNVKIQWKANEIIPKLYDYIQKLCNLGLYTTNHTLLIHCIQRVNEKIILAEENTGFLVWKIPSSLVYSCLLSLSPNCLMKMCCLLHKYPERVEETVLKDFLLSLKNETLVEVYDESSIFADIYKLMPKQKDDLNQPLFWDNHLGLLCYKSKLSAINDQNEVLKYVEANYEELFRFIFKTR